MSEKSVRPNPDRLLEQAKASGRGKLKIFFGACAGVGKTCAMLQEAQRLRAQGLNVLAGVVETHGREETTSLLNGLEKLPARQTYYRGRVGQAFDLDAALARHPALILMDELAHHNAPGSRHAKRWQDVKELLDAGIDVFTTLNVQHLESLNDVISGVTGIKVRETVPDPVFDDADEIVLVDLPPDDLCQRLHEGKVYLGEQAERAIEHFFRKGNLIALRELALRRTADRVDEQMRHFRDQQRQEKVWHTRDAILLCIGPQAGSEKLIRATARLAAKLGSAWHAVYVETPGLHGLPKQQRRAILAALRLAQVLGAETATLAEPSEVTALIRYAREHNLGKIITGRQTKRPWLFRRSFTERLAAQAPDLDFIIISPDELSTPAVRHNVEDPSLASQLYPQWRGCLVAMLMCSLITLIASQWLTTFDTASLAMLYFPAVVLIAMLFGRWPSVFATVISVISFDLFFIAPHGSLVVSDVQYLITFTIMLSVGLIIGNLTAGIRYQAKIARYRERRTHYLYEMSKALADGYTAQDIATTSETFINSMFNARSQLLLPDQQGDLVALSGKEGVPHWDRAIARWSFTKGEPAGHGTDTLSGVPYQILPLRSAEKTLGLLVLEPASLRQLMIPEQQRLLETLTLLIASAIERQALILSEAQARIISEREQVRHSLLAALSHDLRTPLTVLLNKAEALTVDLQSEHSRYIPQASEICQQVLNTTRLVNNLLEMARIQADGFTLRKEWLTTEELIGSALKMFETHQPAIQLIMSDPLALISVDGPLFERVLINLLENAIKYAGPGAIISLVCRHREIEIRDNGPGIPAGMEHAVFDKFTRGSQESSIPGIGLGLAICKTIVDLHGGTMLARNRPEGGAGFIITLPADIPPEVDNIDEPL